jgi:cytochrome b involved in lipid metabolism
MDFQVEKLCSEGKKLIVLDGSVYDVGEWVHKHPGGKVQHQKAYTHCNPRVLHTNTTKIYFHVVSGNMHLTESRI